MRVATESGAATDVSLARILGGMRLAIEQEIAAVTARRPRSALRTARNGRLTLLMNGQQVYTFEVEHPWAPEEDTVVRVNIPNGEPVVASIELSGRGTASSPYQRPSGSVVLGAEHPLPAEALAETRLRLDPAHLLRKLRDALDGASDGPRQLASKAFGLLSVESFGAPAAAKVPGFEPGEAQLRALEMAQAHEVLYVIGPPGTGKTRTLAVMAYQFMRQGLSVLIAAQTNIAVDNALEQLAVLCDGASEGTSLPAGTVARCGDAHLAALRQRQNVNLPILAAASLLQKRRAEARARESAYAEARDALSSAIVAWEQAAREHEAKMAAARPLTGLVGALFGRGKQQRREEDVERAAQHREVLATALQFHEQKVTAAEQTLQATRRKVHALEAYARRLGVPDIHAASISGGDEAEPGEMAPELARELLDEERRILGEARVVGATLTKSYLLTALQGRRFDAVIVDEASMAALPALYLAAARADQRLVLIGDPRQLPPIVKSKEPAAREWLGRDIFAAAGVELHAARRGDGHAVMLDEQRRMRPEVSLVARRHVYDNLLRDHPEMSTPPAPRVEPLPDYALVLCDTSDATSDARPVCSRPSGSSRVNVYHAICTFLLGLRALKSLEPIERAGSGDGAFRVGLITPYRKQADLLQRLIQRFGLGQEMLAGTVHHFQGLECDTVVFDTVESEGLPLTPLTAGGAGTEAQCLTNVAITRGRHKLIIVANKGHLERRLGGRPNGGGSAGRHTLWEAVREAAESAVLDSRRLISLELAAAGTADETLADVIARISQMFLPLSGVEFDAKLRDDVTAAQRDLMIVSPYVTDARVDEVLPLLQHAIGRGLRVRVVTGRRSGKRSDRVSPQALARLTEAGVEHVEQAGLHQKAVFVDGTVAYVGSLNVLSYTGRTQELMVRIEDAGLTRTLRRQFEYSGPARD